MRDAIARALVCMLGLLLPARGRHAAAPTTEPGTEPAPVNPWSRPWTGPTKEEAAEFFRQQAENTLELHVIRERRRAAVLATMGTDYPYSYPGAPFPASAFTAEGRAA
ncbi:hypothetical protein [Streptomyces noursei]|uniref:Uncharacterized protein n=1 Tax=Streptomyces noursei TaxID=1971 RepID=A0A401QRE2_STRNR|nr:hypothetical protein [Streptomyces noursei]MCZ0972826.1 hypothetical protein [Streptomyces noursei]UWS73724.1 hypothetical protein N1H47_22240 [Streptomyces noursei]GCB87970.1 hypothetical protein SALB_00639 [Streptomyces noursei]GCB92789.1 hypothetical protein SALB_05564 [Streptomyces noursei]